MPFMLISTRITWSNLLFTLTLLLSIPVSQLSSQEAHKDKPEKTEEVATKDSDKDKKDEDKWDVAVPAVPADTISFKTNEGTWISVDVHPNGDRIVFDILGDIYTLPISGGEAELISGGLPYEVQPRFSPDGKQILFTSDRGGGDNIWIMNSDGTDRHAVTEEKYRLPNNAVWHPSGEYIVAKKHFTSRRSLGAGEMWMYRLPEGGGGVKLTKRKNDQQDVGEPEFSPDGKFLYWSEDMSGGSFFQYNKDPNGTIYMIRRLDMEKGEIRNLISLQGGAVRPAASPDGKTIAFIRRIRTKSVLCLYDIESGDVRELWDGLDKDMQENWALFGVYPGFDYTPDGKSIVISAKGKIWRVDAASGKQSEIAFTANVEQIVAKPLRFSPDIGNDKFDINVIRWPQLTPDSKEIVFQAQGYLYSYDNAEQTRSRITRQNNNFEFAPYLSLSGKNIVYVTWNDRTGGRVMTVSIDGRNARTITKDAGHYTEPAFSPDEKSIVYRKGGGGRYRGSLWTTEPGIYLIDSRGNGKPRLLTREGASPRFSKDGKRIYLDSRDGDKSAFVSINLLGSDKRVHATSEHADNFLFSPDEKWLAFEELWQTYVVPFPGSPAVIAVSGGMKNLPVKQLSEDAGTYLNWSSDSKNIRWSLGPEYFNIDLDSLYIEIENDADTAKAAETDRAEKKDDDKPKPVVTNLGWSAKRDIPNTNLYLVGGTILPMNDMSVIENGIIHVEGNRITEIGTVDDISIPSGAKTIDVSGKTIMPGFVDIHAHVGSSNQNMYSQQSWSFLANLAFGITTIHDPSNFSQMIFATSELVSSGQLLGPRVFSTGTILYGAEGGFKTVINKYDDAVHALKRTKAWGAFSVKSYNQPRREQRQMIIKAGLELEMMVVPEGGATLNNNMTQLLDGHTTIEHAIPIAPLYEPELRLLSRFGTGYTPTLVVGYGGLWGENYWYQHTNVWENERLLKFIPRQVLDSRSRRRPMAPDDEYHHFALAATVADVVHRGGNVQIGSHGQLQGLAAHWEIWMFTQGGMTNHEALRAASWMGARALGMDDQIGSLQKGMLADLIIFDSDPIDDIRQSENILYTMINGRLFDAASMNQLEPERKTLPAGPYIGKINELSRTHECCLR